MRIKLLFFTIIHLKFKQVIYQIWYRLKKNIKFKNIELKHKFEVNPIVLNNFIEKDNSLLQGRFTFLNQSITYKNYDINWNENTHGKLWAYNLNYMDYLLMPEMDENTSKLIINDFINKLKSNQIGREPYPISIRNMNWIIYVSKLYKEKDQLTEDYPFESINKVLYEQYHILTEFIEYNILGNHLLENAFSLLFGAYYFKDFALYKKAKRLLYKQLNEQILNDGGHFELSTMYHIIILNRVLDSINLLMNNHRFKDQNKLLNFLNKKVILMLGWLNNMTFSNNNLPLLNDSAVDIAPTTEQLFSYAKYLGINESNKQIQLADSGYRRFNSKNYECIIDIGNIGASYQPGHAHADTFNFVLNAHNNPLIVDNGISTYESGNIRITERGTKAHNTVTIDNLDSSEVWSSFRIARRAKVRILKDSLNEVFAKHNGYKRIGIWHQREWYFKENEIIIRDNVNTKSKTATAHIWFHKNVLPNKKNNVIYAGPIELSFSNNNVKIIKKEIPDGYNKYVKTYKLEVEFKEKLETNIRVSS